MLEKVLKDLNAEEEALLFDSIPYITILIAGSDGLISDKELSQSEKITQIRSYVNPDALGEFYARVGENFNDRIKELIKILPSDAETRNRILSERLSGLSDILRKVDMDFADIYYESLKSFARHVAEASGGFLGFGKISYEEAQFIDLPMIEYDFKGKN